MEHQKILNLLNETNDSKFMTINIVSYSVCINKHMLYHNV